MLDMKDSSTPSKQSWSIPMPSLFDFSSKYNPLVFSFVKCPCDCVIFFGSMSHFFFSIKDLLKMKIPAFKTDGVSVEEAALAISNRVCWIPVWNNHHCCPDCVVEAYFLDGYCHLNFGTYDHRVIRGLTFDWRADRLVILSQPYWFLVAQRQGFYGIHQHRASCSYHRGDPSPHSWNTTPRSDQRTIAVLNTSNVPVLHIAYILHPARGHSRVSLGNQIDDVHFDNRWCKLRVRGYLFAGCTLETHAPVHHS